MLRTLSNNVLSKNPQFLGGVKLLRFNSTLDSTAPATFKTHREIRDVQLMGIVHLKPLSFGNGSKLYTIRTNVSENVYHQHRVRIQSPKILSYLKKDLEVGQRVFVRGELRSQTYKNSNNKLHQSLQVRASEMYVTSAEKYDDISSTPSNDENNVRILSYMTTDVFHGEKMSLFNLGTHRKLLDAEQNEQVLSEYFTVCVHDPRLIEILKRDFQQKGRVLVTGYLNYSKETNESGKICYFGKIEATNILKIDRFSEASE